MTTKTTPKKLSFAKQTLKELSTQALDAVVGGTNAVYDRKAGATKYCE